MKAEELIEFEKQMALDFEAGLIKAPLHLAGGNEDELIKLFKRVDLDRDWLATTWRSHLHCLLAGVPPQELREAIHAGRSINLCFPSHRIVSSAIVGGIAPIALGLAWALKRNNERGRVWCFLGDMTFKSGIAHETMRYAMGHDLPIWFVIEDNGLSVVTNTREVWGEGYGARTRVMTYHYKLTYPHVGVGKWVKF